MGDAKSGPYIIGFNGPPRSGKDTLANILTGQINRFYGVPTHRCILAAPMRQRVEALVGRSTNEWYEKQKDVPLDILCGDTPRRCMIKDSEDFLKHNYGQDFWAKIYHHQNRVWWDEGTNVIICSDIGFAAEVQYFCENSKGYLNILLSRPGTDFSIDSRNYVDAKPFGGQEFELDNDSFPFACIEKILQHMQTLGWKL
jgi:hypothetical protein